MATPKQSMQAGSSDATLIFVGRSVWRREERVDIRNYYFDYKTGDYLPTKKGISVPVEKLDELLTLIHDAFPDEVDLWIEAMQSAGKTS